MNLIEKQVNKYKSLEFITLIDFYKIWDYNKTSKIALIEEGETKPCYVGFAWNVPIIYGERRILKFSYPEEKDPIITLKKYEKASSDLEYDLWKDI